MDVNIQNNDGITALMRAAFGNSKEIVNLLLNHKDINVNIQDDEGNTALMHTVLEGSEEVIKLLQSHSNIDRDVIVRRTKEKVELLLDHPDIDVNIRDEKGKTALVHAVEQNNKEEVELLLNHPNVKDKIDVNLKCDWGKTLVLTSEMSKMPDKILEVFASRKILRSLRRVVRVTALSLAAAEGHEEVVKLLLDRPEIDVNACFPNSALANAVYEGHREVVKLLLDHPKINVDCAKVLEVDAINKGHTDIAELLRNHPKIKNGMSLSYNDLISLACSSDEKVIKSFLDQGVSVNKKFDIEHKKYLIFCIL